MSNHTFTYLKANFYKNVKKWGFWNIMNYHFNIQIISNIALGPRAESRAPKRAKWNERTNLLMLYTVKSQNTQYQLMLLYLNKGII
jgi:hypothetical protein